MTYKKEKLLSLQHIITTIEEIISKTTRDTYKLNDSLTYCFLRNKLKFKKLLSEREEIVKFIVESYNTENDIDKEELSKPENKEAFKKYEEQIEEEIKNSEKFKDFLKEEIEMELYKIPVEKLEGVSLPGLDPLFNTILEEFIEE